nr:MAG TPA: hypothetical protein [Caudoviricetes sp.]
MTETSHLRKIFFFQTLLISYFRCIIIHHIKQLMIRQNLH